MITILILFAGQGRVHHMERISVPTAAEGLVSSTEHFQIFQICTSKVFYDEGEGRHFPASLVLEAGGEKELCLMGMRHDMPTHNM